MNSEKHSYHIYIFPLVLIYCEVLLRIFVGSEVLWGLIYPILFGIGTGILLATVTSLFSRKINRLLTLVFLLAIGFIFTAECLIYRSMQYYMPLGTIVTMAGAVAGSYTEHVIQAAVFSVPIILLFFAPAILYWRFGKEHMTAEQKEGSDCKRLLFMAVKILSVAIIIANAGNSSEKYTTQYHFDTATKTFGLVSSLQLDAVYSVFRNDLSDTFVIVEQDKVIEKDNAADDSSGTDSSDLQNTADKNGDKADVSTKNVEIVYEKNEMDLPLDEVSASTSSETIKSMNEYVKSIPSSSQDEYTGLFKGKNLILICAEAFSFAAIDEKLTPTLYRLTHNGFYFSDYYQPSWNGSTSTGEYSMLMGIAPLKDVRTMPATEGNNLYFTMGNQLQRLGYSGNAYHNGGYKYYSRHLTHKNLGYDEWIAQGSGLEDLASPWPSDSEMFEGTLPTYIDNQPFSVYYMSVSGHFPYKGDDVKTKEYLDYVRQITGDKYDDKTQYYLCYQMELEHSLAYMVEQLEAKGIADDTVICITADHYPYGLEHSSTYGNNKDYIEDLYGYYPKHDWERDKNAWILWSGCLENEEKDMVCEISEPTYSLDILPTLSNLFGLEYDSRLLVGRDVFSETAPLVLWTNHSWVTDKGKYDSDTGTFYPNPGVTVEETYVEQIKTEVANKLSFSGKILDHDYYEVLLGNN